MQYVFLYVFLLIFHHSSPEISFRECSVFFVGSMSAQKLSTDSLSHTAAGSMGNKLPKDQFEIEAGTNSEPPRTSQQDSPASSFAGDDIISAMCRRNQCLLRGTRS